MTTPYYWTKRCGPRHITGDGKRVSTSLTLCGKPMLGNNYAYQGREDAEPCDECEKAFDAETDPKRTT
jgi:hypothetical protein